MTQSIYSIPRDVVEGWKTKRNMREWELSKFIPFARLYYVFDPKIDGQSIPVPEGDRINANIVLTKDYNGSPAKQKECTLIEVGGLISQTHDSKSYRGGFGVKDCSVRYNNIEAGAFEVNISVFISNLQQINDNYAVKRLFYPGGDFILIYGWSTDNNEGNIFKTSDPSARVTIDLNSFDGGMRRNLYCTLHSFNWEFSEIGKIEGSLKFFAPDAISSIIRSSRFSKDILQAFLSDDLIKRTTTNSLYEKLNFDINKTVKSQLQDLYDKNEREKYNDLPEGEISVVQDDLGIRVLRSIVKPKSSSNLSAINADVDTYIYVGWVLEAIKNQLNSNNDTKIDIQYEDIGEHETKLSFGYLDSDNNVKWQDYTRQITNSFFIPINLKEIRNFIDQFRGGLKDLMIDIPEFVISKYNGLELGIFKLNNTTWILDDRRNKMAGLASDYLKDVQNGNGRKVFTEEKGNTIIIEFGTKNALTFNVKVSSLIPPDLIWTLGLNLNESEAAKLIREALDNSELRENNPGYKLLFDKYIAQLETDKDKSNDIQKEQVVGKNLKSIKENPKAAMAAWKAARSQDPITVYKLNDNKTQDKVEIGTILMNYFNGLMITLHGTAGLQAYQTFLFKGFDMNADFKGVDGFYSTILINDVINKRGYQTIIEASKIRAGSVE